MISQVLWKNTFYVFGFIVYIIKSKTVGILLYFDFAQSLFGFRPNNYLQLTIYKKYLIELFFFFFLIPAFTQLRSPA